MSRILSWERTKDPDEFVDYTINWANQIGSDTITASSWAYTGDPDSLALVLSNGSFTTTTATIWANGGNDGTRYTLTNHITTFGGRIMEQSVYLTVRSR